MNAAAIPTATHSAPSATNAPQLRTILLTDLCDSTQLVERLGDTAAAQLFRQHDLLVLQLQQQWRGRLIDRSDGMLLLFERPIDGLGFALDYARGLRELGRDHDADLKARAGLHVGEVLTWRNSDEAVRVGAKPLEVEGLAKPMAARLMTVARPGQILVSAVAEPLAHRSARELGERGQQLLWKSHGRWRFKGLPNPQEIFEVGEAGIAPLRTPKASPKAWRDIPLWRRPAALAAEVALVIGIGLGIWFVTKPQPAIAFNQRDWVVVADLRNLTGQPVLDDSLEQAFRISLEQSRYVNVLSDLKARQTLERMRLPEDTELTRAIASEIAIRDGARAVILPTVAEIGGHVRVSAEVIDPHSQTTVYSEYADGRGAGSALASIDDVTAGLRETLGEAMESIDRDSDPLPVVTTDNLDALRAYALGQAASAENDHEDALRYFEQASKLDPTFALAYLGSVRAYIAMAQGSQAMEPLHKAIALKDRLPAREALYLEAWSAEFQPGHEAPGRWKRLAEMYPDYYAGFANYAYSLFSENRFAEGLPYAKVVTAPQNALRGAGFDYVGRINLAMERYTEAATSFDRAVNLGHRASARRRASVAAAQSQLEKARLLLSTEAEQSIFNSLEAVSFEVDAGNLELAREYTRHALDASRGESELFHRVLGLVDASVATLAGNGEEVQPKLDQLADDALEIVADRTAADRVDMAFIALGSAYTSQRNGNPELASRVLNELEGSADVFESPIVKEFAAVVRAKQEILSGYPRAAIDRIRQVLDGSDLFQSHVVLRDAYAAAGDYRAALAEDQKIAQRRGLAYIEMAGGQALQSLNVADTRLAHLRVAEAYKRLGNEKAAREAAHEFSSAWPPERLPDYLRRRLEEILPASNE